MESNRSGPSADEDNKMDLLKKGTQCSRPVSKKCIITED